MATTLLLVLFATWLLAAGGAVGSFLNVVVYRVPLRLSIVRPGSHCPKCQHPIRPRDNIPVFGWLLLRGRCRDCRAPISPRYPIVEFVAAAMFLAVGWCEWLAPQGTAPVRPAAATAVHDVNTPARADVETPFGEAGLLAAFHLVLLATVLATALVEFDGQAPPWRMAIPAAIVGAVAPLAWPSLRPVPAWGGLDGALAGAVDGLIGLAAGGALGAAAWLGIGPRDRRTLLVAPALAGLFLGAQMVAVATPAVALIHAAARCLPGKASRVSAEGYVLRLARLSPGLFWWAVALAWILSWNMLVRAWPWLARPLGLQ